MCRESSISTFYNDFWTPDSKNLLQIPGLGFTFPAQSTLMILLWKAEVVNLRCRNKACGVIDISIENVCSHGPWLRRATALQHKYEGTRRESNPGYTCIPSLKLYAFSFICSMLLWLLRHNSQWTGRAEPTPSSNRTNRQGTLGWDKTENSLNTFGDQGCFLDVMLSYGQSKSSNCNSYSFNIHRYDPCNILHWKAEYLVNGIYIYRYSAFQRSSIAWNITMDINWVSVVVWGRRYFGHKLPLRSEYKS